MKPFHKFLKNENFWATLLVCLTALVTHGILLPQLGFYRDDWYMLWTASARGTSAVTELFMSDRPFIGYLYALDYMVIGVSPLGWHVYALLLKIAGALSFLWLLRLLWPKKHLATITAAILYVVYPGFYQQPNATTYVNLLLAYLCAVLSIALTVRALLSQSKVRLVLALTLAFTLTLVYLFIYESLIGMEAVRFLLIGYILVRRDGNKWKILIKNLLKWDFIFAAAALFFVIWRLFIFESTRRSTRADLIFDKFTVLPSYSLGGKVIDLLRDLFETVVFAWAVPYYQFTAQLRYRDLVTGWLVSGLVLGLTALYWYLLKRSGKTPAVESDVSETKAWLWLGAAIILVTSLPIILAGRNVIFASQWDRYTAQSIVGVALFLSGVAFTLLKGRLRRVFIALLIFLGVSTQYQSAVYYRDLWAYQKDLWWQLSWRAPGFKPGTTLIASLPQNFQLTEDYEVWGPANFVYPSGDGIELSGQVIFDEISVYLLQGTQEQRTQRNNVIPYDYTKALVVSIPTEVACLHTLDNQLPNLYLGEPADVMAIAPYSHSDVIDLQAQPTMPPVAIFGPEPEHTWCYYYQKIELANQAGQWTEAASLADDANRQGLSPRVSSEWLPVLTAYANSGQDKKASETAKKIRSDRFAKIFLCEQFDQVQQWPAGYNQELLLSTLCTTGKD